MSKIESVAIERDRCQGSLPEWSEALCTYVGRMPSSSWAWDLTKCVPRGGKGFAGFIECATLGDVVLAKVATSTPHDLTFALHHDEELASPAPLVVMRQPPASAFARCRRSGRFAGGSVPPRSATICLLVAT